MTNQNFMNMRIKSLEEVLFRELEGEAVLLNLNSEEYFGLDEVGTTMWQTLMESNDIATAVVALLEIYDIDEVTLKADLRTFIDELAAAELIMLEQADTNSTSTNDPI